LIRAFARLLGIHEFTLIKREGGRLPHPRYLENLKRVIPGLDLVTAKDVPSKFGRVAEYTYSLVQHKVQG